MRDTLFAVTHAKKMRAHVIGNVTMKLMISGGESRSVGERGEEARGEEEEGETERTSPLASKRRGGTLQERILSEREPLRVSLCVVTTKPSLLATVKATNRREAASRHNAT